jgi:23S rRNA pseudouridine1911/1915/1917 synthase
MISSAGTLLGILHEDQDLLVIDKPVGLVCHPTKGDSYSSLIGRVRLHLSPEKQAHMINRLDRETSGVVLVAKNLETAREIRARFESRTVRKLYVAIVHGWMEPDFQVVDAPLGKDTNSVVAIKDCVRPDGAAARTEMTVRKRVVVRERNYSVLHVRPRTGRKHQIRIHLAHVGHPLVGDKLYGSNEKHYLDFVEGRLAESGWRELLIPFHALHCAEIAWNSPSGAETAYRAPEPERFSSFLNGAASVSILPTEPASAFDAD